MWAAEHGHYEAVRTMIEHRVDVTVQDNNGATALHLAAYTGNAALCQLLIQVVMICHTLPCCFVCCSFTSLVCIQHGAVVDTADSQGHTALFRACECGHSEAVLTLLQHGASVYMVDSDGRSCLHWAASAGHDFICTSLLHHGVEVDMTDNNE